MVYAEDEGFEKLCDRAVRYIEEVYPDRNKTFKVHSRRARKDYPKESMEINADVGEAILNAYPEMAVDVHEPEILLNIEIREKIYIYSETIPGPSLMLPISSRMESNLSPPYRVTFCDYKECTTTSLSCQPHFVTFLYLLLSHYVILLNSSTQREKHRMGNFQNIFKRLRISAGLTQVEMAKKLGISRSTIGMYETGAREPDFETLEKIADFFNVDTDYLLGRTDKITILPETAGQNYIDNRSLTRKDERDIKKILDQTREQLLSQEGLMFDGDPASPEAIDSILAAMQIGMEMAKKKNKEKYTAKKHKKD